MDIGLYKLKYPARKVISFVLPLVRNVSPNTISWMIVPVGLATAGAYFYGAQGHSWLYLVAIGLILIRMFLGTLDGLTAVHYKKGTDLGELVNRVTPELCDVMCLVALTVARPEWRLAGIAALALGWLTSFSGLLGAVIGKPTQSVGPVGPTDRLVALQILSLCAFLSDLNRWDIDFLYLFLLWCSIGGSITVILRLTRHFRSAGGSTTAPAKD